MLIPASVVLFLATFSGIFIRLYYLVMLTPCTQSDILLSLRRYKDSEIQGLFSRVEFKTLPYMMIGMYYVYHSKLDQY